MCRRREAVRHARPLARRQEGRQRGTLCALPAGHDVRGRRRLRVPAARRRAAARRRGGAPRRGRHRAPDAVHQPARPRRVQPGRPHRLHVLPVVVRRLHDPAGAAGGPRGAAEGRRQVHAGGGICYCVAAKKGGRGRRTARRQGQGTGQGFAWFLTIIANTNPATTTHTPSENCRPLPAAACGPSRSAPASTCTTSASGSAARWRASCRATAPPSSG